MDEQAMLTRDLVLRLCANATEFDQQWLRTDRKVVVPFTAARDTKLIRAIIAAGDAMGVDRLLVCRTRAEYAYEPVTEVPGRADAIVALIRSWGDEPTDFVVAVEDFSAAVLVTASTLTVAAGPDDFVRQLVGSDMAQARVDFGEEARTGRDPDLLRAAQQYGCLEFGGRHARGTRGPGPDLVERIARRAESMRENYPATVSGLRVLRGTWGWAMVVALLLASVFVEQISAVFGIAVTVVWLLFQLAWPARSRTVSFATLTTVLSLGAVALVPIALAQQTVAATTGIALDGWAGHTYIAVPTEEVGKLVPVVVCWLFARHRFKRLASVDYLLLAAASGAGFHLAERGLRALVVEPPVLAVIEAQHGLFTLLPGWYHAPEGPYFSGHAVTTGLIGAAFGLATVGYRRYGAWLWALPPLAAAVAAVEHMTFNAAQVGVEPTAVTSAMSAFTANGALTRWILLLLLVLAVILDYRLARPTADVTPPLPGHPPLGSLRRWARGYTVRMGARVPGDIAPVFRRVALAWARLPAVLVTTLSSVLHEFALSLVAASRGPGALCDTWRFLRRRRALAMGAARAGDRAWRRFPSREEVAATERDLASRLDLAPVTAAAVGAAAVMLVASTVSSVATGARGAAGSAAYAATALRDVGVWLDSVPQGTQTWVWVAAVALLSLLATGWRVPHAHPGIRNFLRAPGANTSLILGAFAPGQLPYAVTGLVGMALPRGTSRLLRG
ncbi:PrsW family glutamic-type intramembrane protease [Halostreptopolyspora alba]|uniref:PrsW family intramembrane metalloprotease n=1 Tax=Halostreptopolyspora alba TaxID=2487137 RepID=A0A3N0E7T8_9ACTN|nr:PrsW family intramembrane metalloprotease [Nocardiopsaceae bacterium YIM 96095]